MNPLLKLGAAIALFSLLAVAAVLQLQPDPSFQSSSFNEGFPRPAEK